MFIMSGAAAYQRLFELGPWPARWDRDSPSRRMKFRQLSYWMKRNSKGARESQRLTLHQRLESYDVFDTGLLRFFYSTV